MLSEDELSSLLEESDFLMEGLEKGFWRLIKLSVPEIWENLDVHGDEYLWVVAIIGNWCVYHTGSEQRFAITRYSQKGEVKPVERDQKSLERLMTEVISSRFNI